MTAVSPLRPADLARDLQELATLVGSEQAVDDVLRRGLDWLARVAPYDLATVFVLEQGRLVVRAARGPLADDRVRQHALALEQFPSLREALETRRARTFLEEDHRHGDGIRSTMCWTCRRATPVSSPRWSPAISRWASSPSTAACARSTRLRW